MKQAIILLLLLGSICSYAQTQGKIGYEEYMELNIELPPELQAYADQFPTEQRNHMDLFFNPDESMYMESLVAETAEENPFEENNGFQVNIRVGPGGEGARTYIDLSDGSLVRAENVMGKKFLVTDETGATQWKITNNQREILGYTCLEAMVEMDSTEVTAWFAPELPVSVGPGEFRGLPGAILALLIPVEDTELMITAQSIELGDFDNQIARPTKGKKVTQEEFETIMEERMQEMEKMYGGNGHESEDGSTRIKIIRQ